ncbi:cation diffusion facilitator family transporter [Alkalihalophilus lindianensis]|uniref:Cation diffusion facilitator family transporter n=1 Tax=Alkalihalophilus lindianensis TaxID=1630542 RepID=A0ABU3X7M4_9BACI|nr:cation diffusion facilitator family transporter [Alkalihalophilus lindianensis]MDV2683892.1 cation diffusion facilitator family transporter [Alkalihalophilus lindianensis]
MSEKGVLMLSVYGALLFAVIGVVWGLMIDSQMILFDGGYSFISVVLSLLSLLGATYIKKRDEKRFPFGKEVIEPIIIIAKYVVILLLCVVALISSGYDLLNGGREVAPGYALAYSVLSTLGCLVVLFFLTKRARNSQSGFIEAEQKQWLMDTLLSVAVLLGFLFATLLTYTKYVHYVVYIDPLMVLLVSLYCLKLPYVMIRDHVREVLEMSPAPQIQSHIHHLVKEMEQKYQFVESVTRTSKVGEKLYIEIDFILDASSNAQTVKEHDLIREEMDHQMKGIGYTQWLTISFTQDRKWA